ncbi:MAG: alpha-L-fucosidase, partial [Bacteroidaceae bacterium]|nr:alpha-L-fucosidase [Bacteroidaceae bacterium]
RADGTFDEKEEAILREFGAWMKINGEAIYSTRPWKIFGEGPIAQATIKLNDQGFNDDNYTKAGSEEIRFTQTDKHLYAAALAWPKDGKLTIKSLAQGSELFGGAIKAIELLGYGKVKFERTADALVVTLPEPTNRVLPVLKIKK